MTPHRLTDEELRSAYAEPVQKLFDAVEDRSLSNNRKLVSALLLNTLHGYRSGYFRKTDPGARLLRVLSILFVAMIIVAWLLMTSESRRVYRPTFNTDVGFYSTALLGVVCLLAIRLLWSFPTSISLIRRRLEKKKPPRVVGFSLGRIDHVLDSRDLHLVIFSFFFLLVMQTTLLSFTRNHCGIDFGGDFKTSLLLTLDNLFHGVLLDVCELYGINLAGRVEHNVWSASIFLFFRLGYDAMALLLAYFVWQRWTTRRLFRELPADSAALIRWIETEVDRSWFKKYPTEYTFLVLAKQYVAGQHDVVRAISSQFEQLGVLDEVRGLFVDDHGNPVFLPPPASQSEKTASQPETASQPDTENEESV